MKSLQNKRLIIIQRVLTPYRCDSLKEFTKYFKEVKVIASRGESSGGLKSVDKNLVQEKRFIFKQLKSIRIKHKGDSRGTFIYFYPQVLFYLFNTDIILLEGTTNIINNIFIIPFARLLNKKVIWWDAGYSPENRTKKRKLIDAVTSVFIRMTNVQTCYSKKAQNYMEKHMGAKNCYETLNTINTTYFEEINKEVIKNNQKHQLLDSNIKLLYVGAIEERKRIFELIEIVHQLNTKNNNYTLDIIGSGDYVDVLKQHISENNIHSINFHGAIYEKAQLKDYYFNADLFVLPGDGGLAIVQSLLFGLPVVCISADGTEEEYMSNHNNILNDLGELNQFLEEFYHNYDRNWTLDTYENLIQNRFINNFLEVFENA